ncbi:hypothetical protein M501DRAFT_933886 [Patellaria atrata CBS 101060]|uniref:Uncharacterized protein n=1 Tax=Patellaria atrata CBS 101060 TaxID=1346257 RepID=A0A9P4SD44_9PEZI|nr:hypothetical protein M501DRAFT_933886 [Patellaria atrata CBS 101060]
MEGSSFRATPQRGSRVHRRTSRTTASEGFQGYQARKSPGRPKPPKVEERIVQQGDIGTYIAWFWNNVLHPTINLIFSILFPALLFLKPLMSFALAISILFALILGVRNFVASSATAVLSPICQIPGVSYLDLPFCASEPSGPVEFDRLMNVQSSFEDILSSSETALSLPVEMKHSEASIRDLKLVVKYSSLPSRNELEFEFTGFIDTAREASSSLTRFNSRIGSTVDHILSINRWTLRVLSELSAPSTTFGIVPTFLSPFQSKLNTGGLVRARYLEHTSAVEEKISTLILEAQALLKILDNLDARLDIIADIAARDGLTLSSSRDELLASLWTKLGGNRHSKKKLAEQLALLQQVSAYRRIAWAHVSNTVMKLQGIAAGLEDLRERVGAPDVLGVSEEAPLEMHLYNIQLAIERLEEQRGDTRNIERELQRKLLGQDGGELPTRKELPGVKAVEPAL